MNKRNNAHYMFAAKINWLNYQLKGANSNIYSATYQVAGDSSIFKMTQENRERLQYLVTKANMLSQELAVLSEQIAEFSKKPNKYKMEKPSRPQ